nr:MAG TPA: hypothetical protein [Caudoviricetes sp.]
MKNCERRTKSYACSQHSTSVVILPMHNLNNLTQ